MSYDYISGDKLLQQIILSYLPPKSLVRFILVNKSWQSLIKDSNFITTHLDRTRASNDNQGNHLLFLRYSPTPTTSCDDRFYLNIDNNNTFEPYYHEALEYSFPTYCKSVRVLGCCNGLICLSNIRKQTLIVLWNPSIQKSLALPEPEIKEHIDQFYGQVYGFGFDSQTNDYKVVRLVYFISSDARSIFLKAQLYKLSKKYWKDIDATVNNYCLAHFSNVGTAFVNGSVHWRASKNDGDVILSFDMSKEKFHEIMLPEIPNMTDMHVAVCGEWLSFFYTYESHCYVWVMKEYKVTESWIRLYSVPLNGEMALGFRENHELILAKKNRELVSYDCETRQAKDLNSPHLYEYEKNYFSAVDRCQFTVAAYVESLVLLGSLKERTKQTPSREGHQTESLGTISVAKDKRNEHSSAPPDKRKLKRKSSVQIGKKDSNAKGSGIYRTTRNLKTDIHGSPLNQGEKKTSASPESMNLKRSRSGNPSPVGSIDKQSDQFEMENDLSISENLKSLHEDDSTIGNMGSCKLVADDSTRPKDQPSSASVEDIAKDGRSEDPDAGPEQHIEKIQDCSRTLFDQSPGKRQNVPSKATKRPRKEPKRKENSQMQSLSAAGMKWESGVRRSTRIKMRPLEYWKGERFLYGRIHQSLATVIGVKYASPAKGDGEPSLEVKSYVSDKYKELVDLAALH